MPVSKKIVAHLNSLLLLSGMSVGVPSVAQEIKVPFEKFVLPNGLTVIVHEDHKAPLVAINTTYHVGSADEIPGRSGFAHLFEHLMYGGSEHVQSQFLNALTAVGATDINGTTSYDRTNFFETVPVSALDYALFAESDRMGHLQVTQETLDLQRGVVENELRQDEDAPYGKMWDLIARSTYPASHPYAHQPLGSIKDLDAATLADVKGWLHDHYGPSNATLTLAGDITVKRARELVEKYFAAIPPGQPATHRLDWVAKLAGPQQSVMQDRVPQTMLLFLWNIPGFGNDDEDSLDLVRGILTEGKSSRLYKKLVYDEQVATEVSADVDSRVLSSQFMIQVVLKPGVDAQHVRKVVEDTIAELIKSGPTPDELARVKAVAMRSAVGSLESVRRQAAVLAQGQVYRNNPADYEESVRFQQAATPQMVQEAAAKWISGYSYELEVDPYPSLHSSSVDVDRSKAPSVGATPEIKLPEIQEAELSNGLKVVLVERHELPLVDMLLLVKAGYSADRPVTQGLSQLTSHLLTAGTDQYSALQLSSKIETLGAQLTVRAGVDNSVAALQSLSKNLTPSLDLFADVMLHPTFPREDFLRQQKLQLAMIRQEESTPSGVALRVLPPLLFGASHPYGQPLTGNGTPGTVAKLTRDDVEKFYETWYKPNNAMLIVGGDTTMAQLKPELEKAFGLWKRGVVPQNTKRSLPSPVQPGVYLVDKPGQTQSVIIAGTVAPRNYGKDSNALDVWNEVFGSFSGRVNMDLRETKHWTYGAYSFFLSTENQRPYLVYTSVQADKTKESLAEIKQQLDQIATDHPPTDAEIQTAVNKKTRSLPGSVESLDSVLGDVLQIETFNLQHDYFSTLTSKYLALQPTQVSAASSFLHPNDLVWVVAGDRSKIEDGVRSLNLGMVHIVEDSPAK